MQPASHSIGRAEQAATRIAFFIAGFGMAAWAPLVPYAKLRTGADDGQLGLILLCMGLGSILTMPFTGPLAGRVGCRRLLVAGGIGMAAMLPLLAALPTVYTVAAALFVFGAALGTTDVVANIQAVIVEKAAGRPMMSGFHGLFSVGGFAGSGSMALLLWIGAPPLYAALGIAAIIAVLLLAFNRDFLRFGSDDAASGNFFALPHGIVILLSVFTFILFLAEGAMVDWSAVVLTALHGLDPAKAGIGYVVFSIAMTACRLTGDRVVARLGDRRIVLVGALLAAAGMGIGVAAPSATASLAGFLLVGIGCANIVPVLFTAAGRQTAMPQHLAVAAISVTGYTGILLGPALIGLLAHATSLTAAFMAVAAALIAVAVGSRPIAPGAKER